MGTREGQNKSVKQSEGLWHVAAGINVKRREEDQSDREEVEVQEKGR